MIYIWEPYTRGSKGGTLVARPDLPSLPIVTIRMPDKVQEWRGGGRRADRKLRRDHRARTWQQLLNLEGREYAFGNGATGRSVVTLYATRDEHVFSEQAICDAFERLLLDQGPSGQGARQALEPVPFGHYYAGSGFRR